ncbi:MAG: FAD-dependent monooxygenase [Ilumatobacteraceae bacterium]
MPRRRAALARRRPGCRHDTARRHVGHDAVGGPQSAVSTYDVAVVGLGPTGATMALALGRRGHRVVVFERSTEPYSMPRACHLDAEVARILARHGLEDDLHDLLTESAGMEYVDGDGVRLFTFEGFERAPLLGWHEDYVFVQPELEEVMRRHLTALPSVEIRLGVEAPSLDDLRSMARFVVACDGASSGVRQQLGVPLRDLVYDEPWLVVDVMLDREPEPPLPDIIQQVCDPARLATFVPSHGAHRRWEFLLAEGEDPDPWTLLERWGVTPAHGTLVRAVRYRFHALVAEQWRVGTVFLAGDAAHMMPPFMGQGLCSGVRDADNLAWRLDEVLGGADEPVLDGYATERRAHAEQVIAMSVDAGRTLARLAADPTDLPQPSAPDPTRWSRLPGLDLGGDFPVGHQLPQPDRLDDRLPTWCWVASDATFVPRDGRPVVVEPRATYGHRAVLVRPDRYIAAVVSEGAAPAAGA